MKEVYFELKRVLPDSVDIKEKSDSISIPSMNLTISYHWYSFKVSVFLYVKKFETPSEVGSFVALVWKKYCNTKALLKKLRATLSIFDVSILMFLSRVNIWDLHIQSMDDLRWSVSRGFLRDYRIPDPLVKYEIKYDEFSDNILVTDRIKRVKCKFTDSSELCRMLVESLRSAVVGSKLEQERLLDQEELLIDYETVDSLVGRVFITVNQNTELIRKNLV